MMTEEFKQRVIAKAEKLTKKEQASLKAWLTSEAVFIAKMAAEYFAEKERELHKQAMEVLDFKRYLERNATHLFEAGVLTLSEVRQQNAGMLYLQRLQEKISEHKKRVEVLEREEVELTIAVEKLQSVASTPDPRERDAKEMYRECMNNAEREKNASVKAQYVRTAGLIMAAAYGMNGFAPLTMKQNNDNE